MVKVRCYRPFDGKRFMEALPASVKSIAVLDRTKEPGSYGEPLFLDVVATLAEASTNGLRDTLPADAAGLRREVAALRAEAATLIRDIVAPAENSAMSNPDGSAVAASSTTISPPFHGSVVPADRSEAKNRTSSAGKFRSSSNRRMTAPTWPVAPTTPSRTGP